MGHLQLSFKPPKGFLVTRANLITSTKSSAPSIVGNLVPPSIAISQPAGSATWTMLCTDTASDYCKAGGTDYTYPLGLFTDTLTWSFGPESAQAATGADSMLMGVDFSIDGIAVSYLTQTFGTCWDLLQDYPDGKAQPLLPTDDWDGGK